MVMKQSCPPPFRITCVYIELKLSYTGQGCYGRAAVNDAVSRSAHVDDDELYPLWTLAATTGMRRSELLGLRWRDLDLGHSRLSVDQTLVTVKGVPVSGEPKTSIYGAFDDPIVVLPSIP